jgi:vesicle-fusing ATPase
MSTAVPVQEATTAEEARLPLVAEVEHLRALLRAYREGGPTPAPPEAAAGELEPPIDRLARLLALSGFERQLLLLTAAVELDSEVAAHVAAIQETVDPRPTFALALATFPQAHWDALAPESPLRRLGLVELGPAPTLASRPLRIAERVVHHLAGIPAHDERLNGVLRTAAVVPIAGTQLWLADELAQTVAGTGARVAVRLDGEDEDAQLGVAQALAAAFGRIALVVRGSALPPAGPELSMLARLVDRECVLLGGLPVVETWGAQDSLVAALLADLDASVVVIEGESPAPTAGRLALHRSVNLPKPSEARALWMAALDDEATSQIGDAVEEVAQHFRLSAGAIDAMVRELAARATGPIASPDLRRLCRERARVSLAALAERLEPVATWDDLVLPDGHVEVLHEIVRHVRHRTQVYERWGFGDRTTRGLGVSALFSGESGTGKTLAAEVIATELDLDLYRIDLATTVSKYIGETEKNLRKVFAAAEASGAVLLFDEADALFGKRGEVKDGHDRYANLEVAYLLQRMESYRGLAILTTNLHGNVDRAFMRRLRFVVSFPFPDARQRADIWRRTFPDATPLDGIDADELAKLVASGGTIRSIALSAAFSAAEEGTGVTPAHVLRAAQVEYAKTERALTDAEAEGLR